MPRQGAGLQTSVGLRPHRIRLQEIDTISDGDGGYIEQPTDLNPPEMWAHIRPASVGDLENIASGTVVSAASHIVQMPHHPGVSTETSILFGARRFSVIGLSNPDERNVELIALCAEVVK